MNRARLLAAALLLTGCVSFHDRAGVPLDPRLQGRLVAGRTTRAEVLDLLGPPTGHYSTNLLAVVTRVGSALQEPWLPARVDDDVFTYQDVEIRGRGLFFPVLFFWVQARITSRTLIVFFDERGLVRYTDFREDRS